MTGPYATDEHTDHSRLVGTQCDYSCAHALPGPDTTGKGLPDFENVGIVILVDKQ
ncbi:MAG: hypothetical protein ACI9W2_003765 [Gammaproteobacteria bacterium]|jgi:hypothetical protein